MKTRMAGLGALLLLLLVAACAGMPAPVGAPSCGPPFNCYNESGGS